MVAELRLWLLLEVPTSPVQTCLNRHCLFGSTDERACGAGLHDLAGKALGLATLRWLPLTSWKKGSVPEHVDRRLL